MIMEGKQPGGNPLSGTQRDDLGRHSNGTAHMGIGEPRHRLPDKWSLRTNAVKGVFRKFEEGAGFDTDGGDEARAATVARSMSNHRTWSDQADQNLSVTWRGAIGMELAGDNHRQPRSIISLSLGPFAHAEPDQPPFADESVH